MVKKLVLVLMLIGVDLVAEAVKLKLVQNENRLYKSLEAVSDDGKYKGMIFLKQDINSGYVENYAEFYIDNLTGKNDSVDFKFECITDKSETYEYSNRSYTRAEQLSITHDAIISNIPNIPTFSRDRDSNINGRRAKCDPASMKFFIKELDKKEFQGFNTTLSKQKHYESYYLQLPDGKNIANIFLMNFDKDNYISTRAVYYPLHNTNQQMSVDIKIDTIYNSEPKIFTTFIQIAPQDKDQNITVKDGVPIYKEVNYSNKTLIHQPKAFLQKINSIDFYINK